MKLDISGFKISSQTTPADRVALETLRLFVEQDQFRYRYLEIGSYLGGTLLPHVQSLTCEAVLSVDKRVSNQADERRSQGYSYEGITTARLLEELSNHADPSSILKLTTFDGSMDLVDCDAITARYPGGFSLAFIDGEHTNEAVFSDFLHTTRVLSKDAIVALHDSWMIYSGILNIISYLDFHRISFHFRQIGDNVTAFFLGRYSNEALLPATITSVPFHLNTYIHDAREQLWKFRRQAIESMLRSEANEGTIS